MIWLIIIGIIGFILFRYFSDLDKDNADLQQQSLDEKFAVIVNSINEVAYGGFGKITILDKRNFKLYQAGENQIINFKYGTGYLTITWKYKYFQKEIVHERQFHNVRNLSLFEQQKLADIVISEMEQVVENHRNNVIDKAVIKNSQTKAQINAEALADATVASRGVFDVLDTPSKILDNEVSFTSEYWIVEAFKAMEKSDNDSARLYAEKALQLDNDNIDISLIYWSTLIKKIKNPSIQKLETNLKKAIAIYKEIRDKKNNGDFVLNENQIEKFSQLAEEQWEFHQYADDTIFRIEKNF